MTVNDVEDTPSQALSTVHRLSSEAASAAKEGPLSTRQGKSAPPAIRAERALFSPRICSAVAARNLSLLLIRLPDAA